MRVLFSGPLARSGRGEVSPRPQQLHVARFASPLTTANDFLYSPQELTFARYVAHVSVVKQRPREHTPNRGTTTSFMSRHKWALVWSGLALAILLLAVTLAIDSAAGLAVAYAERSATALVALVGVIVGARRSHGRARVGAALIAAGLGCGVIYGPFYIWHVVTTQTLLPALSPLQFLYLIGMPLCLAGVLTYPVGSDRSGSSWRSLIDGVVTGVALYFIVYELIIRGVANKHADEPARVLETYLALAMNVAGVAITLSVLARVHWRGRPELALIAGGFLLFNVAEIGAFLSRVETTAVIPAWVHIVNEVGIMLIAVGAVSAANNVARIEGRIDPDIEVRSLHRDLRAVSLIPVVAATVVAAFALFSPEGVGQLGTVLLLALILLLVLREIVAARDRSTISSALVRREELFRSLVEESSDLVCLIDDAGRITYVGPALSAAVRSPRADLAGSYLIDLVHPADRRAVTEAIQAAGHTVATATGLTSEGSEVRARWQAADGSWRWMHTRMRNLLHSPSVSGIVCNTRDVQAELAFQAQLEYDANHDALTGLPNLRAVRDSLGGENRDQPIRPTALILCGLDRFKEINDTFGHTLGDSVLRLVSERLANAAGPLSTVGRVGGDTFAVVVEQGEDVERVAASVHAGLAQAITADDIQLNIRMSVGIAHASDAEDADELLRNADLAMNAAKLAGGNVVMPYETGMHARTVRAQQLHEGMLRALDHNHFSLAYQPIVRLDTGHVVSAEALLRWQDPDLGTVSPAEFIPVAEGSSMVAAIDSWVLENLCCQTERWLDDGFKIPRININLSRREIGPDIPDRITSTLARHHVAVETIGLELTESAISSDLQDTAGVLRQLKDLGFVIALDDFGTGQSSLSELSRVPLNYIKIDRSFILPLPEDDLAFRLLESIVNLCRVLDLPMVAEGVETQAVADLLADLGIDYAQGYFFSRPVAPAAFREYVEAHSSP